MFGHLLYRKHILGHYILFKGEPAKNGQKVETCAIWLTKYLTSVAPACVINEIVPNYNRI